MANEGFPANRSLSGAQILARLLALGAGGAAFPDNVFELTAAADATKIAQFSLSAISAGATRTYSLPDASITVAGINLAQTWSATQTFAGINATSIGAGTPGTGVFTTLTASGQAAFAGSANANACFTVGGSTPAAIAGTTEYGMFIDFRSDSSATANTRAAFYRAGTAASAYTSAIVAAVVVGNSILGSGSAITRGYGIQLTQQTSATSNYGLVHSTGTPATGNYFIYDDAGYASKVSGVWSFTDTTDATSTTAAGIVASGGLAIAKKAFIGSNLVVGTSTDPGGNQRATITSGIAKATSTTHSVAVFGSNDTPGTNDLGFVVRLGCNSTAGSRWTGLQSYENGTGTRLLVLQDLGGNVAIGSTTDDGVNALQVTGSTKLTFSDSGTTNQALAFTINHTSSGTPAAGFGTAFILRAKSDTTNDRALGYFFGQWVVATDATRTARLRWFVSDATTDREYMRAESTGTVSMIGFFGAAAVVQPTSTTDLRVALINLGLYATGGATPLDLNGGAFNTSGGITSTGATAGLGYATGAGGTVTQSTSKATAVTLSKVCGTITLNSAALAATTSVAFTWTNTAIAATDYVDIQHDSVGTLGAYSIIVTPGAGSATVTVRNNTAGSLSEAIVLRFFVTKAVTS